ncbi:MAG: hypothetical protein MZV70_62735 [Desulfobacterales bacterium]|nr:hypothetical protein [Desulfobacterales bacterium]
MADDSVGGRMDVFTDVYEKSGELVQAPALHKDWEKIGAGLKALLQPEGPAVASAAALDTLRARLDRAAEREASQGKARAAEILKAAVCSEAGYQDRAALVKQMQHFYLVKKKGGQSVWVVDLSEGLWQVDLRPVCGQERGGTQDRPGALARGLRRRQSAHDIRCSTACAQMEFPSRGQVEREVQGDDGDRKQVVPRPGRQGGGHRGGPRDAARRVQEDHGDLQLGDGDFLRSPAQARRRLDEEHLRLRSTTWTPWR